MMRILKIVTHPIILAVAFMAALIVLFINTNCFVGGWGCEDSGSKGAMVAERETIQTAMYAMMADNNITTVIPNDDTNNSVGVNTWAGLPEGPDAASLDGYLKQTTTYFYYCWDSKGLVYTQNKKDGVEVLPDDAEKQGPCKKTPWDPS